MIAVDTNILVYAYRREAPLHEPAREAIRMLAEGISAWAIPWPCVHEFLSVVTNTRLFNTGTSAAEAAGQIVKWRGCGLLSFIGETPGHFETLMNLASMARIQGGQYHDARVAAICIDHGVDELWSADRDFSRYPALRTRNPLVGR